MQHIKDEKSTYQSPYICNEIGGTKAIMNDYSGLRTLPGNNITPVSSSLIRKRNG